MSENKTLMKEDLFKQCIGSIGKWQIKNGILIGLARMTLAWTMLAMLLIIPYTKFYCVKLQDNATIHEIQNQTCYDECVQYEYDRSVFESSLITEFDLICGRAWLASLTQTVLMLGIAIGSAFFGICADRYGRRPALLASFMIQIVFMYGSSFSKDYWIFNAMRFLIGFGSGGIYLVSSVIVIEIMPDHREEATGLFVQGMPCLGISLMAVFGYYLRNWDTLMLGFSIGMSFLILYIFILKESPRWLFAVGKFDKGISVMKNIAKENKLPVDSIEETAKKIITSISAEKENLNKKHSYLDLFATKSLILYTIIMTTISFNSAICYWGINQYATLFGNNIYVIIVILALTQATAQLTFYATNKYFGRKWPTIAIKLSTSLAMVILIFIPKDHWGSSALGFVGVFLLIMASSTVSLIISELYPTTIRNMGVAATTTGGKIGGMVAPFIAYITPQWIPALIFAILLVFSASLLIFIPDTKNTNLVDTIKKDETTKKTNI